MKTLLASAAVAATALVAASAAQAFPAYGADSQPGIIITYNAGGGVTSTSTGQGPYDSVEDTYIGIVNNSSHTVGSINLTSSQCIGCFDGDGLAVYGAPTPYDGNGYGGPQGFFTNNTGFALTVNFVGGVAPGATTYFSLEEPVTLNLGVPEPTTWALMLIGFAGIGYAARRRRTAVAA